MCPFALIHAVLAFNLATPITVEWVSGPWRPTVVVQQAACTTVVPAVEACAGGPHLTGLQWSPFGTSTTRGDFTVIVESRVPLTEVRITRPGGGSFNWFAPNGQRHLVHARNDVAQVGTFSVLARDEAGCQLEVRGTR